jgi:PAS domain S-box-containing protein
MDTQLERNLLDLKPGDHVCPVNDSKVDQLAVAVPFIKTGLARGERCVFVADDHSVEEIMRAFEAARVDVAHEKERGALRILTKAETFLLPGEFHPEAMIDFLRKAEAAALADGFTGFRFLAEMTWALDAKVGEDQLVEYEARLTDFLAKSRSIISCNYNRSRFGPRLLLDMLRTHRKVILGELVSPNPYYDPPEFVLHQNQMASDEFERKRVDWWIARLTTAMEAEMERNRAEAELREETARRRIVFNSATVGMVIFSHDWQVVDANQSFNQMLGRTADEVLQSHPWDWDVVYSTREKYTAVWPQLPAMPAPFETKFRRKDGSILDVEISRNLIDWGGQTHLLCVCRDITESKLAMAKILRLSRLYAFSNGVNEVIARFDDTQELYEKACRIAVEQCGFVMAWVGLVEPGGNLLKPVAHSGKEDSFLTSIQVSVQPQPLGFGTAGRAYREDRVVYSNDIETDPNLQPWREEVLKRGYRSCAAFPLKADGKPMGVFLMYADQPGFFDVDELRLLTTLAENISFAIDSRQSERQRALAEHALRESQQQLRALASRLESLREDERTRISREVHDDLGQKLTGLKMDLQWLESRLKQIRDKRLRTGFEDRIVSASKIADETMAAVQRIAAELRPAMLDSLGLIPVLRSEASQFESRTGVRVKLNLPADGLKVNRAISTAAYRIFQEILTNVARHAQATEVQVTLQLLEGRLHLVVADNGKGLSPDELRNPKSLGLLGMKERAAMLKGDVQVEGAPGRGTTVRLEIPIENRTSAE